MIKDNRMMRAIITKFILIGCCCGVAVESTAQKQRTQYVMLDMLDSLYDLNRYTLNAQDLYGVDETIEIYNIHAAGLVLFSILPDFTSDKNWSEVDLNEIQDQVFGERSLRRELGNRIASENSKDKKTLQYSLVKSEGGKYFRSNQCLAEFFFIDTYPSLFNVPYGTINTGQDTLSIQQMKNVYRETLNIPGQWSFPMDVRWLGGTLLLPNRLLLQREYLSREFEIDGEKAYQFWTFTDWNTHDGYNLHRGIDRFIYMPEKGVVGGSYDFWFLYFDTWSNPPIERKRNNKTKEELWQNVLEEKVMLAEELKR
ncbi:hypothetical protein ACFOET_04850 [Parapedobacter deserti]|uniref:YARHG domain-containing protein n=1 Tax=Parapedobacter deserti TaxID=1912957 RepID=A0ABV7JFR7_9SPHI